MSAPFHYSKEYSQAKRRAIGFGIPAIVLTIFIALVGWFIYSYNTHCAGPSCDGSYIDYCTPKKYPGFFTFVFIMMVVAIILACCSIYNIVEAKKHKIPIYYTNAELACKVIYDEKYYKYRDRQTLYTILGVLFTQLPFFVLIVYENTGSVLPSRNSSSELMTYGIVCLAFVLAAVGFFVLANINRKKKLQNAIRVTETAITGIDYGDDFNSDGL